MEAIVRQGRECDPRTLLAQIGAMNFLAISGGRFEVIYALDEHDEEYGAYSIGVRLPVAQSRSVEVTLDWSDTYRVRRVRKVTQGAQRGSEVIEAEQTEVYFDEVGEVAYGLSCWK